MGIFNILNNRISNNKNSLSPENSHLIDNENVKKHYSKEVEEDIRVILEREKTKRHELTMTAIMTTAILIIAYLILCLMSSTK